MIIKGCRVWFTGSVQGVGFRYSTRQIAKTFEVCGCVKNLADGRVELIAEGVPEELRQEYDRRRSEMIEKVAETDDRLL